MRSRTAKSNKVEDAPIGLLVKKVNEGAKEISRINEAMGLGQVVVRKDGVYREFSDGTSLLIKKGNFSRKKLPVLRVKVR